MGQSPSAPVTYPPDFSLHFPSDPAPQGHPPVSSSSTSGAFARPPPGCPMHQPAEPPKPPPECPMHASIPAPPPPPAVRAPRAAQCPIKHDSADSADSPTLNPLNQIPTLTHERAPGQKMELPVDRTSSSIPRPNSEEKVWEYPSPQQFYNALVRKGWETPEEHVETMVEIHNFLNEEAWQEVMKWEKRLPNGEQAQLAKFQGNPGKLSPKARLHLWAGMLFPSKFITEPPFDRHDWVVTRPSTDANAPPITTRYVIDYHSAPPDDQGNPVFFLDVRPALDSFESIKERIAVAAEETWRGFSGEAPADKPTTRHV